MSETATAAAVTDSGMDPRKRRIALWVILLAFAMDLLDSTIVNIGIPSIQRELGASYAAIQWIVAGYQLTFALLLITGGRLGDIFGYRRVLLIGMSGFALTSALCGFAVSSEMLVAARLAQGLSAALMVPQTLALMQVMYPSVEDRQRVSALYGAVAGVATVSGPIIGALLITGNPYGFGWRTIFLINLPFAVVAIGLGLAFLPDRKSPHPLHIDSVGVGLILLAMLMLMFPLIEGRQLDWPRWAFWSIAASLIVFVVFGASQIRKDRRDGSPLVVPHLFRVRSFVAGITISLAFYAVVASFFLVLTIFLQIGIGYDILTAGLTSIPFSLGIGITVTLAQGVLVPRMGRTVLTVGPLIMAVGFGLFMAEIAVYGGALSPWAIAPVLFVTGVGMGCVVAPIYPFVLAQVPVADAGSASGVINAVGQVGGAVGVAAVGVVFFGLLGSQATVSVDSVRDALSTELAAAGLSEVAVPEVVAAFATCFDDRANAKDLSDVPPSCAGAERAQAAFAASDPDLAAKVGAIVARQARTASHRNFSAAMMQTLAWQVAALFVVSLMTFFLPMRPKRREELEAAGAEM
jgi:EmrB/QacA subfamily drug resistance transporter